MRVRWDGMSWVADAERSRIESDLEKLSDRLAVEKLRLDRIEFSDRTVTLDGESRCEVGISGRIGRSQIRAARSDSESLRALGKALTAFEASVVEVHDWLATRPPPEPARRPAPQNTAERSSTAGWGNWASWANQLGSYRPVQVGAFSLDLAGYVPSDLGGRVLSPLAGLIPGQWPSLLRDRRALYVGLLPGAILAAWFGAWVFEPADTPVAVESAYSATAVPIEPAYSAQATLLEPAHSFQTATGGSRK